MPSPKSHRRGSEEKNRKGKLAEKASSFHGRSGGSVGEMLPRPRTVPDLLSGGRGVGSGGSSTELQVKPKLTKLLLNVTIQRSLGAVQVVMSLENSVEDLIAAALKQYAKEGRRPILPSSDPSDFDLHYSQFSLESLSRGEKLNALGSRNFFLCSRRPSTESGGGDGGSSSSFKVSATSRCSNQAEKAEKTGSAWVKFMDFLR